MALSKKHTIYLEIIFFTVLFVITLDISSYKRFGIESIFFDLKIFLVLYCHAMVNRIFLFKYLFPQRKYLKYFITTAINFCFWWYLDHQVLISYDIDPEVRKSMLEVDYYSSFSSTFISLIMMTSIQFFFSYFSVFSEKAKNEKKLIEMENKALREQLNPHFLFNALNNAYGLSLAEPNKAPNYILSLAQLMRYQVEMIKKDSVPLTDELNHINNYILVEIERVSSHTTVTYQNNIDNDRAKQFSIAPLLFINLIENCFKYASQTMNKSQIEISISENEGVLHFQSSNTYNIKLTNQNSTTTGIENLKRRLELYKTYNELTNSKNNDRFETSLTLKLKEI